MAKGYTTAERVQAHLGRVLTPDQITHLNELVVPAVEEWIDSTGGRAYGESVVTAEPLSMLTQYTWLSKAPVLTVDAVRGWYWGETSAAMQALAPYLYTIMDGASGQIRIPGYRNYAHLEVDYTPDPAIPGRIALAATIVCGVYMRTVLHPETEWLTDYSSAQDIRLKFRDISIPENVYELIGSYGNSFVIA